MQHKSSPTAVPLLALPTPTPTPNYCVLGWQATVRYEPLADLYEAWVPQHPQVLAVGKSRREALCALRERLAAEVGVNAGVRARR